MASVDPKARPALQIDIRGGSVAEAMALLAMLPEHVAMEVASGAHRDTHLFVRGVYVGPACALQRLRELLAGDALADVTLRAHATLAGVFGPPVSAMQLVLDPTGALGTG